MRNFLGATALATASIASVASAQSFEASITRTTHNIPHITSDTWGGVGFGVAYAYAQDNFCLLAEEFTTLAGERSLYFGPEERKVLGFNTVDNLTSDTFFRGHYDLPALREGWAHQTERVQQITTGYIAGYNRFLSDTGAENLPEACRNAAWVRPITSDDMLRLNEKQMLLASSLALAPGIATAAPPDAPKVEQTAFVEIADDESLRFGSNGWAFGGDVTADGTGLLIGNPHFPWAGPSRFWQLHVTKPGEYDVMGVGIAGTPLVTLGFNKDIAWTHTVTAARHFTVYTLALSPDDPTSYLVDGEPVKMTQKTIKVPMPDGAPAVERTLYSTQFGSIVTIPGTPLSWSKTTAFAIRDANAGNQRALDTWMRIGQASNVGEIETAVSDTLGIPWVNTIAADRNGDALHADITAVPDVSSEFIAGCSTPFTGLVADRITLLDGTRSQCNWRRQGAGAEAGLMSASDQAARTRRDYVTNSNDSYWISHAGEPYRQLSPILGKYERELTLRTRHNFTRTEAILAGAAMDHDVAKELVFGNQSHAAELVLDTVVQSCSGVAEVESACTVLSRWDGRFNRDSRGAYLFDKFWDNVRKRDDIWTIAFDPADPIHTPRELAHDAEAAGVLTQALAKAAKELEEAGIALDAPWGEVLAYRLPNGSNIPLHGGPHSAGLLNMQESIEWNGGRLLHPRHGSSYIQIVSFDDDGPIADAILSYSQSTDPASPFFSDQTRLYSSKKWNRLPFSASEIEQQKQGETLQIRE